MYCKGDQVSLAIPQAFPLIELRTVKRLGIKCLSRDSEDCSQEAYSRQRLTLDAQLELLEEESTQEDAEAGARHSDPSGEQVRLGLADRELRLQVLGQKHKKSGDDRQLHAGAEAGHDVHWVRDQVPHALGDLGQGSAVLSGSRRWLADRETGTGGRGAAAFGRGEGG